MRLKFYFNVELVSTGHIESDNFVQFLHSLDNNGFIKACTD